MDLLRKYFKQVVHLQPSDPTWLATEAASEPDQGSESKAVSDAELKNLTFKHHIFNRSLSN